MKILIAFLLFTALGCGEDIKLKKTEYLINGVWLACSLAESNPCGNTYKCGDRVFQCQVNTEMRLK